MSNQIPARGLVGLRFGKWTVEAFQPKTTTSRAQYLCRCDCGTKEVMRRSRLTCGRSLHCGCERRLSVRTDTFWSRVQRNSPDKCWPYMGLRASKGYGLYRVVAKRWLAHRWAWTISNGEIPDGMCVLHMCDNPPCCNPAHLWLGTVVNNNQDRHTKGRTRTGTQIGESSHFAKLTAQDVIDAREAYESGKITLKDLAHRFAVHKSTLGLIVNRKTWRHIP